jgi:ABC transporter substrate binding protein
MVGVLMNTTADDSNGQRRLATFLQKLQQLGWSDGHNVRIATRWAGAEIEGGSEYAAELIRLVPDVILASNAPSVSALQQRTRTLPIVFVAVADPVGSGLVASLGRPSGNVTGFTLFEYCPVIFYTGNDCRSFRTAKTRRRHVGQVKTTSTAPSRPKSAFAVCDGSGACRPVMVPVMTNWPASMLPPRCENTFTNQSSTFSGLFRTMAPVPRCRSAPLIDNRTA